MRTPDPIAIDEAVRLRRLGYSWEQACDLAMLIVALSRSGFLAMVPEDFDQHLRPA